MRHYRSFADWLRRLGARNHPPGRRSHQSTHERLDQSELDQPNLMRLGNRSTHESSRDETQRRKFRQRQVCRIQHVMFHRASDLRVCGFYRRWNNHDRQPHGSPNPPIVEQQFPNRPQNSQDDEGRHGHKQDYLHDATDRRLFMPDVKRGALKIRGAAQSDVSRFHPKSLRWINLLLPRTLRAHLLPRRMP